MVDLSVGYSVDMKERKRAALKAALKESRLAVSMVETKVVMMVAYLVDSSVVEKEWKLVEKRAGKTVAWWEEQSVDDSVVR
jgi:hypothetical protein